MFGSALKLDGVKAFLNLLDEYTVMPLTVLNSVQRSIKLQRTIRQPPYIYENYGRKS